MDQSWSSKRLTARAIAFIAIGLFVAGAIATDYLSAKPADVAVTYVGRSQCIECHSEETQSYTDSHHDRAMAIATDRSVLGDFNNAKLEHDGIESRFFRERDRFIVRTEGETGQLENFEVKYVFGVEPLQQYMVEFDRPEDATTNEIGRLQVLRLCWDTEQKKWFYLRPPDVPEKLTPDDPLHWTGVAQRWQTMCAKCHSTNLHKNFDVKTASYQTTFSEIDVSCEACHGPGSLHVELASAKSLFWDRNHGYGLATLKGEDPELQLEACAPCHSRRGELTDQWNAGNRFCNHYQLESLRADTYHDDGQIKDEVYVYGSFLQSKMYHKGIRCTDCHDPHSLELKHPGNQTCTSCHQHAAGKYDVPSHHHHPVGSAGAKCVNCHMPHTTYMDIDQRRDHSLRVPRPDLSVKLGTPNACSGCHVEDRLKDLEEEIQQQLENAEYAQWLQLAKNNGSIKATIEATDQWCDQACEKWYGADRQTPFHFAQTFAAFRRGQPNSVEAMLNLAMQAQPDSNWTPEIARASALHELADNGVALGDDALVLLPLIESEHENPMLRAAAVRVLGTGEPLEIRKPLLARLDDSSALVRVAVANTMLQTGLYYQFRGSDRLRVDQVIDKDVFASLMSASDRAASHLAWAGIEEIRGNFNAAVDAYQDAMRIEPNSVGPRTNLAALLERLAQEETPERAQVMRERAAQFRKEELPLLERDAKLASQNAAVQYRYGLALYLDGQLQAAMGKLDLAVKLDPENPTFQQARRLLEKKLRADEAVSSP